MKSLLSSIKILNSFIGKNLPNGNRTEKQQMGEITRYAYDNMNRLAKVEYPTYTEELYYDKAGNRSRRTTGGMEELYQYDPLNRLTEYTKGGVKTEFTYDKAGNLLADDKARYTYDAFNRTEKAETFDDHVQINRYDAEGLRHEMEEDGKLVRFIFRGDEVIAEETENKVTRFIRGYDLVASDAECARTYYHYASDEMGSITHVVSGVDKEGEGEEVRAGSILNRYEYDAWGNLTVCEETVENRFKFNGQQYDPITGQYYLRARYYNPVIARFTQEDTYRGDGLNLYAYCRNNPVYYVDPSGHWCDKKENVYKNLLNERGITEAELANNPDLKLSLMAEASNIVRAQKRQQNNNSENDIPLLPGPEPVLALPDNSANRPRLPRPVLESPNNNRRNSGGDESGTPSKGHTATWELLDEHGNVIDSGVSNSGGTHPGRVLTWDEQLKTHTEYKILEELKVNEKVSPGSTIVISGTRPPCNPGRSMRPSRGCQKAMQDFANAKNVNILYFIGNC